MADTTEAEAETKEVLYQLAYCVSERVQINNVILAKCEAARSGDLASSSATLKMKSTIAELRYGKEIESNSLNVMVSFDLKSNQGDDNESEGPLSIKASFVIVYSVTSFDGINDDHIGAFAATNGVFNAWPYWREFVQSTAARMGFPKPLVVPVYRLGQAKFTEQDTAPAPVR